MDTQTSYVMRDGHLVTIRPIAADDAPLLADFYCRLSDRTRQLRFHARRNSPSPEECEVESNWLTELDPANKVAWVALVEEESEEQIVAVVQLAGSQNSAEAEWAVVVRDDFQNQGLGTRMLRLLVATARSMDIQHLVAWVMAENLPLLHIVHKLGLNVLAETRYGETYIRATVS